MLVDPQESFQYKPEQQILQPEQQILQPEQQILQSEQQILQPEQKLLQACFDAARHNVCSLHYAAKACIMRRQLRMSGQADHLRSARLENNVDMVPTGVSGVSGLKGLEVCWSPSLPTALSSYCCTTLPFILQSISQVHGNAEQ